MYYMCITCTLKAFPGRNEISHEASGTCNARWSNVRPDWLRFARKTRRFRTSSIQPLSPLQQALPFSLSSNLSLKILKTHALFWHNLSQTRNTRQNEVHYRCRWSPRRRLVRKCLCRTRCRRHPRCHRAEGCFAPERRRQVRRQAVGRR